jgi:tetratricopeptide (TPR) repeat protein
MTEWDALDLDALAAARASLPVTIMAPRGVPEREPGAQFTRATAAAWARDFVEEHPDDPRGAPLRPLIEKEPLWAELEPLLADEEWVPARALLERVLELDPGDASARFNRASALRNLGEPEAALEEFLAVRPTFDDQAIYHANLGRTHEDLGQDAQAVTAYRRTLELDPGNAFALNRLVALGQLVIAAGAQGEPVYVERADFEEAVRSDLAQNDANPAYLANAANVLLDQGHADLARAAAQLALAADPANEEAHLVLGTALTRLGDAEAGLRELDGHVERVPASAVGQTQRAHALYVAGRRDEARAAAERALALDPGSVTAAQVAVAGDDGPRAALARAIALAGELPRAWAVWRVAGDLALANDDPDAAVEHFERAIEGGADDTTIGAILGELGQRGRIDDVCRLADGIPRLATRDPGLRWNAASALEQAGRNDEARIVFASIAHDARIPDDLRQAASQRAASLGRGGGAS